MADKRRKAKRFKPNPKDMHKYNLVVIKNEKIYVRKDIQKNYVTTNFNGEVVKVGSESELKLGDIVNQERPPETQGKGAKPKKLLEK